MQATWYFDPISPFAHLALTTVERLAQTHAITPRPVVFGALLSHWGQLGPAEIPAKRLHTYRLVQHMADRAGIPLRFPPGHPFRSLDALRLLAAINTWSATRAVMDFIWAEGRDPARERDALAARLSPLPLDTLLETTGAKARLRQWTDEAIARDVFGVPTLVAGPELFWGVDALPMAEAYLADPAILATPEMTRLATLPTVIQRPR